MKKTKLFKTFLIVLVISIVVAAIYMVYFFLIGVPKTQARTYYNMAMQDLNDGNKTKAKEELQKALSYWPEGYIQEKLDSLN